MISSIDPEKCTGCGTCFKSCPLDVFRLDTEQREISPCTHACPAGTDIRACHYLLQQGRSEDALDVLKRTMPLPAVTGRVCFHPCESACTRKDVDEALNINALEQFLGDLDLRLPAPIFPRRHLSRVAVVGSGPAGLATAWYLAEAGYPVTVFESMPEPGGMLRYGIPAYRLPDEVMELQIRKFRDAGVEFVCSGKIGGNGWLTGLKAEGFRAVVLAVGASRGCLPGVPGENVPGVMTGMDFLRALRSDDAPLPETGPGRRVLVVGGGDVAMDAAISARRLGAASVEMVCLESQDELPAFPHNVAEAVGMGIPVHGAWGPTAVRVGPDGRAVGLECRRCLSLRDDAGRFAPTFDENPESAAFFKADTVIFAIGQRSDLDPFAQDVKITRGRITVSPETLESSCEGVFAAGDAVSGPASVCAAVAGGRRAAVSVDRFLSGAELRRPETSRPVADDMLKRLDPEKLVRLARRNRPLSGREGFAERRAGLPLDAVLAEAGRCLTCGGKAVLAYTDDCMTCYTCEVRCPAGAVDVHPFKERLPRTLDTVRRETMHAAAAKEEKRA